MRGQPDEQAASFLGKDAARIQEGLHGLPADVIIILRRFPAQGMQFRLAEGKGQTDLHFLRVQFMLVDQGNGERAGLPAAGGGQKRRLISKPGGKSPWLAGCSS